MTLKFETMPLSTNQLYRVFRSRSILSAKGRTNKEAIGWEARAQYKGKPLTEPLQVSIALYWPDKRRHDLDNLKALYDSLNGIVWDDDSQIVELHLQKFYDPKKPRVEISVVAA